MTRRISQPPQVEPSKKQRELLDDLQNKSFAYFVDQINLDNGLVEITAERIPGTSFVICSNKSRCQKNIEERQLKILLVTSLCSFYRTNGFLNCCFL